MKKIIRNPLIILALGLVVIAASSVGAARAAIVYQTAAERINFSTATISVDLQEKVDDGYVSVGDELTFEGVLADEGIKVGKHYDENIRIVNNSNTETGYSEYVRVTVRKSWFKDGKSTSLDPGLISLDVAEGWYLNEEESTSEQSVYYMTSPLACGNAAEFLTGLTIKSEVTTYVETKPAVNADGLQIAGTIVNEYLYNGESVYIQIQADAVQTHNAEDAIYAAWGVKATCDAPDDGNIISIGGRQQ